MPVRDALQFYKTVGRYYLSDGGNINRARDSRFPASGHWDRLTRSECVPYTTSKVLISPQKILGAMCRATHPRIKVISNGVSASSFLSQFVQAVCLKRWAEPEFLKSTS